MTEITSEASQTPIINEKSQIHKTNMQTASNTAISQGEKLGIIPTVQGILSTRTRLAGTITIPHGMILAY